MVIFYPILKERLIERGRREGRAEALRELQKAWEEWNARRIDAQAQGVEFNEPPPSGTPSPDGR